MLGVKIIYRYHIFKAFEIFVSLSFGVTVHFLPSS